MNSSTEQAGVSPPAGAVGEAWGNIPEEMRKRQQWAVADKEEKAPRNPVTLQYAKVDDSSTWGSFEQAVQAAEAKGWGVGYILSPDDPFTIIDLDNKLDSPASAEEITRQQKIIEAFSSYTEKSVSGRGHHIVVRGKVPKGVRRGHVEVYSDARFMLCTGDVVLPFPVVARQDLLDTLFHEMGGNLNGTAKVQVDDQEAKDSDEQILQWAMNADNAANFRPLWEGVWEGKYGSQSEADMALMSMLRFYTKNVDQLFRLFRQSELGKRDKAQKNDTYLTRTLKAVVRDEPPPVDFSKLSTGVALPPVSDHLPTLNVAPGLMGEIAQYIYDSSIRPVKEVAVAASIALMAGICGRYYNVSGSGLNLYTILLAGTGVGKSGAEDGINAILLEVAQKDVPGAVDNFIGPSDFSSGQALLRALPEKPCFVSVLGEVGHTLQQISSPKASTYETAFRKALLDLYSKNGAKKILRGKAYAAIANDIPIINSPSVSILGESTQQSFYEGMSAGHILEGLIPRFLVVESQSPRPPRNRNAGGQPSESIVSTLRDIVAVVLEQQRKSQDQPLYQLVKDVAYATDAEARLDAFDETCDQRINDKDGPAVEKELWNRAHLNALRLAALVAVGESPRGPVISLAAAEWAIAVVERSVISVSQHFRQGDIGDHDTKRRNEILRLMDKFLALPTLKRMSNGCNVKTVADQPVVPHKYLLQNTSNLAAFKSHRLGPTAGLKETLAHMVDSGEVQKIGAPQLKDLGITNTRANFYTKG